MASLGELFVSVGANIEGFRSAMTTVSEKLDKVERDAVKMGAGFSAVGERLSSFGSTMTMTITAPIAALGAAVAVVGGKFEQTQTAFTNFLGSAAEAKVFLDELKEFAATTPFEFTQLTESAKKMMAFGFAANEVLPMLRIIGDAVAGIGGGAAEIDRVTLALGQMQAKGKVSAQEMNQLAELGIPAWRMLSEQIGVSIPQAMKLAEQGAISSSEAIPAILAGMNEKFNGLMEQQSKTLLGQWSNAKDQIGLVLVELGTTLVPIFTNILQAAMPLLEIIKNMAAEFAQLDPDIQTAIVAVVGFVAAIGPIVFIAGQIVSSIGSAITAITAIKGVMATAGVGATALAGALSTVGVVVATVAAAFASWKLMEWAYETFEPFRAIVDAVFGFLKTTVLTVIELAILQFNLMMVPIKFTIESIQTLYNWFMSLETVQTVIRAVKETVSAVFTWIAEKIEFVNRAIGAFLSVLRGLNNETETIKPPMNAAGAAMKAMGEEAIKADEANRKLREEQTRLKNQQDELTRKLREEATAQAAATAAAEAKRAKAAELKARMDALKTTNTEFITSLTAIQSQMGTTEAAVEMMATDVQTLMQNINSASNETTNLATLSTPAWLSVETAIQGAKDKSGNLDDAFKTLGITSTTEFATVRDKAIAARDAVLGSDLTTEFEKQTAVYKALQAQIAAAKAAGEEVPAEQVAMLEKLKGELDTNLNGQTNSVASKWGDFSKSVSTVITNFAQDIGKSIFDGDMSWGEKAKKMLTDLGAAVTSAFIEPAVQAITGFITNTIMGALKGAFDSVGQWLGSLGSSMASIFGGGASSAAGAVGGAAGSAGGAAGGIGGAASGAASGVVGIVGAVGSVVGAVSGIIGNFQMAGMNKTLDLIEWNTRKSSLHLEHIFTPIYDLTNDFRTRWMGGLGIFNQEGDSGIRIAPYEFNGGRIPVDAGSDRAISITVEGNVIGEESWIQKLAIAVAEELRLQGAAAAP